MQPPRRPFQHPKGPKNPAPRARQADTSEQGWDPVAAWYDKLVGESGSDYHQNVILPAAIRMLSPRQGESVVDVCCGQGVMVRPLLDSGVGRVVGVDASPRLIDSASSRYCKDERVEFITADASTPGKWADGSHDAAVCLMAVHDVRDLDGLFSNISGALKPDGRAVLVFMHPCFRIPKMTHWGWDADSKVQFRRIDAYINPLEITVTTHPGKGSGEQTVFHHRPLSTLFNALGKAGLAVRSCEELCSHRRSQGNGPFSKAEHRAAEEIPLFMAIHAVKL